MFVCELFGITAVKWWTMRYFYESSFQDLCLFRLSNINEYFSEILLSLCVQKEKNKDAFFTIWRYEIRAEEYDAESQI